jgi:hypothetical protein
VGSSLAWLDSSREDQRRMRELIGLFSDKGSLDELGIGQVRDAFSDLLFPGTSSLHTRARYLVIVPWCYQAAERQGRTGVALTGQVEMNERTVIATLKKAGVSEGLIGQVAGVAVKTLPSTIYWTALAQYGIRHGNEGGGWPSRESAANVEAEELAERHVGMWHPTVPVRPSGFPYELPGGLDLAEAEADWLRDRMLVGASGTLLAHLLGHGSRPVADTDAPWEEPAVVDAPDQPAADIWHAELFSLAMYGAALLYNLLVAERYEREGLTQVEDPVDDYRDRLAQWAEDTAQRADELAAWNRSDMWSRVTAQNPRIARQPHDAAVRRHLARRGGQRPCVFRRRRRSPARRRGPAGEAGQAGAVQAGQRADAPHLVRRVGQQTANVPLAERSTAGQRRPRQSRRREGRCFRLTPGPSSPTRSGSRRAPASTARWRADLHAGPGERAGGAAGGRRAGSPGVQRPRRRHGGGPRLCRPRRCVLPGRAGDRAAAWRRSPGIPRASRPPGAASTPRAALPSEAVGATLPGRECRASTTLACWCSAGTSPPTGPAGTCACASTGRSAVTCMRSTNRWPT